MTTFLDAVGQWLGRREPCEEVISVDGCGTDMAGNTFSGFREDFGVDIRFRKPDGTTRIVDVKGEDLGSLWDHVVKSWPEEVQR